MDKDNFCKRKFVGDNHDEECREEQRKRLKKSDDGECCHKSHSHNCLCWEVKPRDKEVKRRDDHRRRMIHRAKQQCYVKNNKDIISKRRKEKYQEKRRIKSENNMNTKENRKKHLQRVRQQRYENTHKTIISEKRKKKYENEKIEKICICDFGINNDDCEYCHKLQNSQELHRVRQQRYESTHKTIISERRKKMYESEKNEEFCTCAFGPSTSKGCEYCQKLQNAPKLQQTKQHHRKSNHKSIISERRKKKFESEKVKNICTCILEPSTSKGCDFCQKLQNARELSRKRQQKYAHQYKNSIVVKKKKFYIKKKYNKSQQDSILYLGSKYNNDIIEFSAGNLDCKCVHCGALSYSMEHGRVKHNCCHGGKIKLDYLPSYPKKLKKLFCSNNAEYVKFRRNIRFYNNAFSMATFCPKEEISAVGGGSMTVRGAVNVLATTSIIPLLNTPPRNAQIYIYDPKEALGFRCNEICKKFILEIIEEIMMKNPYVQQYKRLYAVYKNNCEIPRIYFLRTLQKTDKVHNIPCGDGTRELAAILVCGKDGKVPCNVDFIVYPQDEKSCKCMYKLSSHIEPMMFPLLFPHGNPGYSINIPNKILSNQRRVTVVQYFGWQLRELKNVFNPFSMAGKLTQQYLLHGYITNEWNRLNYFRMNQSQFRRETFQGLMDHVEQSIANTSDKIRLGQAVILPSSFEGGPRSHQQHYQDVMAMSRAVGRPDLFLTFTANTKWIEIENYLESLPRGFNASDIPHIVCRVFFIRFEEFLKEIISGKVFGRVLGYTYNIEYQKRGRPHAHVLVVLAPKEKLLTPEKIDKFILAEIPCKELYPKIYDVVMQYMLHGPHNSKLPCWDETTKKCSKKFPKTFINETEISKDGFPIYKRRDNRKKCYLYPRKVNGKQISVDNSMVVPYNPYLLMKYQCHINVEYCGSVMAIKYIFKYVNKGHDRIYSKIENGQKCEFKNEIDEYVDTRYLSSMEATWRLLELPTHGMSHSVFRLPVHLPGHQYVLFEEGKEEKAIESPTETKLTAFFKLNSHDRDAHKYKYLEIPLHYTWNQMDKKWQKRKQDSKKVVVRMYAVSPRDSERFFLKLLLRHSSAVTSFEALKTINGIVYSTFKETAYQLGLGQDCEEFDDMLDECCSTMMPCSLRSFFAYLLLTCENINALKLWEKYKIRICDKESENKVLNYIECLLSSEDRSLIEFGFDANSLNCIFDEFNNDNISHNEHQIIAEDMKSKLNRDQLKIYETITKFLRLEKNERKVFFIDGPGGTGKTFLYKCFYHSQRSLGKNIVSVAWTGIAAILLPNGRTAHRFFKLPLTLPESDEDIKPVYLSKQAKKTLHDTDIIIWDEASMIPSVALKIVDITLKDLMMNNELFGGKYLLFGGDYRQVLPIVKRAGRKQIVNSCIMKLKMWSEFTRFTLTINMRANSVEFHKWLLKIGNGDVEKLKVSKDIFCEDLVKAVYDENFSEENISICILLAPLNKQVDMLNEQCLKKIPGEIIESISYDYATSWDSDETDDESVQLRYQPEYLNNMKISGLPPWKLNLKIGIVVMLIRNLCIADGLCNGTRLIIRKIMKNTLYCSILTGDKMGDIVCIPKITLNTKENKELPFILHRRQFPVRLAFAMTINKSQGQTFEKVGLYINQDQPLFAHGQLYVALSRCRSMSGLKIKIINETNDANKYFIDNIVYTEIFKS